MKIKSGFACAVAGWVCWCSVSIFAVEPKTGPSELALELATYADYLRDHPELGGTNFNALVERKLVDLLTHRLVAGAGSASPSQAKLSDPAAHAVATGGTVSMGIFVQQMFAGGFRGRALATAIDLELTHRQASQDRPIPQVPVGGSITPPKIDGGADFIFLPASNQMPVQMQGEGTRQPVSTAPKAAAGTAPR